MSQVFIQFIFIRENSRTERARVVSCFQVLRDHVAAYIGAVVANFATETTLEGNGFAMWSEGVCDLLYPGHHTVVRIPVISLLHVSYQNKGENVMK